MSMREGPPLSRLHRRLLAFPTGGATDVNIAALTHDLLWTFARESESLPELPTAMSASSPKPLLATLIWLLADGSLRGYSLTPEQVLRVLDGFARTDTLANPLSERGIASEDWREEVLRLLLSALNLRPQGETLVQAEDRLLMVSSSERRRVLDAARAAEQRAAAVRQALAEQKAREAADKYSRE